MFSAASSSKTKFNDNKAKVNLKMLTNRLTLLTSKKTNLAKQQKRQVANLMRDDKEPSARILVEHIIREDYTLESYELLRQYAELVLARLNVLVREPDLKPEIAEAVCALLYGGWLMGRDLPELKVLYLQFTAKYGKEYSQEVVEHKERYLNQRLVRVLTSTQVPDPSVVELYLTEIAKAYGVEYTPKPASAAAEPRAAVSQTLGVPLPMPGMPVAAAEPPPPSPPHASAAATPPPPSASAAPPSHALRPVAGPAHDLRYTVELVKRMAGFGLVLSEDNVVRSLVEGSEAEACGIVEPGDEVISVDSVPVTRDQPVKSASVDIPVDAVANFAFVRRAAPSKEAVAAVNLGGGVSAGEATEEPIGTDEEPIVEATPVVTAEAVVAEAASPSEDDLLAARLAALKRS